MDESNRNDNNLLTALKGLIIGGTMLVPGVSGGSMAMILGIYDRLISSVSSFMKNKKGNLIFLMIFSMGGILGILVFASPLLQLIERYPMPMLYFFIGAVAGGVPLIVRQSGARRLTWRITGYIILGLIAVSALGLLPPDLFNAENSAGVTGFLLLLIAGFVTAAALVLPGISVSYLLLLLGLYDRTMNAISTLHLPFSSHWESDWCWGSSSSQERWNVLWQRTPTRPTLLSWAFFSDLSSRYSRAFPGGSHFLSASSPLRQDSLRSSSSPAWR